MRTSYAHRRIVQNYQNRRELVLEQRYFDQADAEIDIADDWDFHGTDEDLPPVDINDLPLTGYADSLTEVMEVVVDAQVDTYRQALGMIASDLLAVYDFIDEWEVRLEGRSNTYSKGQRLVLKSLKDRMEAAPLADQLLDLIMEGARPTVVINDRA